MTVVTSFRIVYDISRIFGTFPYEEKNPNAFYVSEGILQFAKCSSWILLILRVVIIGLEVQWNEGERARTIVVLGRLGNTLLLQILTSIAYKNVFRRSNKICNWLNRMCNLYSSVQCGFRKVYISNLCITYFSMTYYFVTNTPTMVVLLMNGKFLKGTVAVLDSLSFVHLLLFQNIYMVQLLTFVNLARLCFACINDTLRDMSRKKRPREVLKNLKKLRAQHLEVTDYYKFINSVFEIYIFFYIMWSFQSGLVCSVVLVLFDFNEGLILYLWMSYHVFQTLSVFIACEMVSSESKKSANFIYQLMMQDEDPEVKEEIEIFSLQLQHNPVEFNVCGFFILESKLFLTITGIITTYVITLLESQPSNYNILYQQPNTTSLL